MWSNLRLDQECNSVRRPGLIALRPGRCRRPLDDWHHV